MTPRQYDVVVFGASGYTGKYTAEHIATSLPTDLRWAVAGRSLKKLEAVARECNVLNPDRIQPSIEVCDLNDAELSTLAQKTTLLISAVGPYALYGEYAFKACAQNGTHYLDVTGEVPYVAKMIKKYELAAKSSGAIMIPQIGIESAPADLITWSLVNMIREKLSAPTGEVVLSAELSGKPSGGTLNTVFTLLDTYNRKETVAAHSPYAISPIPGPKARGYSSIITKIFGVRAVPDLGILTTSIGSRIDTPLVQRSWGLLGGKNFYGPNFSFNEYTKARNHLVAVLLHFGLALGAFCLAVPFIRNILRKRVTQPGEGPTKEQARKEWLTYKGIGIPDVLTASPQRAFCKLSYQGGLYELTGVLLAQGAISILKDGPELSGGVYTPACLGQKFIDRLYTAGFKLEKRFYDN